jgi:hypothetical protein
MAGCSDCYTIYKAPKLEVEQHVHGSQLQALELSPITVQNLDRYFFHSAVFVVHRILWAAKSRSRLWRSICRVPCQTGSLQEQKLGVAESRLRT